MNPAVLSNLSYGMYVIGTKQDGRPNACVATSVVQVSSGSPEKVLVTLTKDTHSCAAIRENGIFTISVLSTDTPASVIGLSPVGSPTYIPPEKTFDKSSGESFVCSVCGYVYSDPNFSFEELRDNWTCPVCKMPKKAFVRRTY